MIGAENPTRMELLRLRARLQTARRGHRLLKDKRDQLTRQFAARMRDAQLLRTEAEAALSRARALFFTAETRMGREALMQALACPARQVDVMAAWRNVMGLRLPDFSLPEAPVQFPYGFARTDLALDEALCALHAALGTLVRLAAAEAGLAHMAREIEKTRRRVGALEHVTIPRCDEAIRRIRMKLEENERGTIVRLMKVQSLRAGAGGSSPGV